MAHLEVEREAMGQIERDIPASHRERWREAMSLPAGDRPSLVDFLAEAPGKYSPSTLESDE